MRSPRCGKIWNCPNMRHTLFKCAKWCWSFKIGTTLLSEKPILSIRKIPWFWPNDEWQKSLKRFWPMSVWVYLTKWSSKMVEHHFPIKMNRLLENHHFLRWYSNLLPVGSKFLWCSSSLNSVSPSLVDSDSPQTINGLKLNTRLSCFLFFRPSLPKFSPKLTS